MKLSKNLKLFLVIITLNILATKVGEVFINLFLMRITSQMGPMLVYMTVSNFFIFIACFISVPFIKRFGNKSGLYVGNVLLSILYLLIIVLGDLASEYYIYLSLLSGIANSFFWVSMNALLISLVGKEERVKFLGLNGVINSFSTLLGPVLSSLLLASFSTHIAGYTAVFTIVLILIVISICLLLFLKSPKRVDTKVDFKGMFQAFSKKDIKQHSIMTAKTFAVDSTMIILISAILFSYLLDELTYSLVNGLYMLVTMLCYYLLSNYRKSLAKLSKIGIIVFIISSTLLFSEVNMLIVLLFVLIYPIATTILVQSSSVYTNSITYKHDKDSKYTIEFTAFREFSVMYGRTSTNLIILGLYYINDDSSYFFVFGIIAIMILISRLKNAKYLEKSLR